MQQGHTIEKLLYAHTHWRTMYLEEKELVCIGWICSSVSLKDILFVQIVYYRLCLELFKKTVVIRYFFSLLRVFVNFAAPLELIKNNYRRFYIDDWVSTNLIY